MQKIFSYLLISVLCISLIACGSTATNDKEIVQKIFCFYQDTAGNGYGFEVDKDAKMHSYDVTLVERDGDTVTYEGDTSYTIRKGVDVSKWQGYVDWDKVKADGYDFAFMRLGYRGYEEGLLHVDNTFHQNMQNANAADMDIGVYFFSQALSEEEAIEEANFVLEALVDYDLDLPVVYDPEFVDNDNARTNGLSGEQITKNTVAFCDTIKAAGYTPMVYANMYWQANLLDMSELSDYLFWTADYTNHPQTPYDFSFWQYTDRGKVNGIKGNADLNIQFLPIDKTP